MLKGALRGKGIKYLYGDCISLQTHTNWASFVPQYKDGKKLKPKPNYNSVDLSEVEWEDVDETVNGANSSAPIYVQINTEWPC